MNRRSRHLVVLMVAVVTAGIASFAVYRAILQRPRGLADMPHQSVVVAARSLAIGTELTEQDVKVVAWPAATPVPGAIGDVKSAVNRGLLTAVLQNEPITVNKLASMGTAGLPPAIPRGMRAMSVKVNDVIGVAGFVVPGTHVDVVVTIRRTTDSMTRTAASNVQVLAAGTRQDQGKPESDTKTANASTVVTLLVSPNDAERIALAQSEGEIMLMLRNPLDAEPTMSSGVKTASLLGTDEAPAPVIKAPVPRRPTTPVGTSLKPVEAEQPPQRKVEAIRGMKRTDDVIKDDTNKGEVSKADPSKGGVR
jgi:pilus assembly protein CpaB